MVWKKTFKEFIPKRSTITAQGVASWTRLNLLLTDFGNSFLENVEKFYDL